MQCSPVGTCCAGFWPRAFEASSLPEHGMHLLDLHQACVSVRNAITKRHGYDALHVPWRPLGHQPCQQQLKKWQGCSSAISSVSCTSRLTPSKIEFNQALRLFFCLPIGLARLHCLFRVTSEYCCYSTAQHSTGAGGKSQPQNLASEPGAHAVTAAVQQLHWCIVTMRCSAATGLLCLLCMHGDSATP